MRKALTRRLVSKIGAVAFAAAALGSSGVASAQTAVDDRVPKSNGDGMDTHLFRPAVDSKGFFSVNGSDILGKGDISFGLVLDYGLNLMRTRSDRTPTDSATGMECASEKCAVSGTGSGVPALVRNSFQGTFGFNYGIANLGVVGVSIPVLLMTGDTAYQIGPNGALYNSGNFSQQSISGFNLHAKYRITRVDKTIGLAALLQVGLPIGNAPRSMGAEPGAWVWPQIVLEHRMAANRFRIGANVGYRLHGGDNPSFQNDSTGARQLEEGKLKYGNMGTFGVALSLRALDALDIVAESYGTYLTTSGTDSKQKLSQEVVGGLKLFIEKNSYLMMGAGSRAFSTGFEAADVRLLLGFVYEPSIGDRDGDGYKDDQDACPDEPEDFDGFQDGDGCPEPDNDNDGILDVDDRCPNVPEDRDGDQDEDGCPEGKADGDRDGDGILDSKDKCPDIPEDRDGFQDDDGCPEADNDKDGIPDKEDQCPNDAEDRDKFEDDDGCPDPDNDKDQIPDVRDKCPNDPETYNGYQDEDGCPDKGKVVIEGNDIIIFEKVQFETNSARILPASNEILNAVAAVLKGHPEFKVVEVGGHADERGSDEHNLRLTKARAASVMEALRSRGINPSRLLSQGYGEYCPLDDRSVPAAWDKNRRVEFKVVRTEEGDTGVKRGCDAARGKGIVPPQPK